MDYSFYSFYCLDSLEIRLDHNSTYYRSLSKNSDVKARISHCDSQNLQYKTHPEFWPSHRRIFKTSLYYKTRLILETRRYTKRGGITTNLTLRSHGGYVTDVPKYHNACIWSTDQKILRFMFKTYSSSSSLFITSRWFATSCLASPASVRLVYCSKLQQWSRMNKKFCTWHDSCAGVSCAKFCCDMMVMRGDSDHRCISSRWHQSDWSLPRIAAWSDLIHQKFS